MYLILKGSVQVSVRVGNTTELSKEEVCDSVANFLNKKGLIKEVD